MQKKSRFKKLLYSGLVNLVCLFPVGCRIVQDYVDNSPLTVMTESATQIIYDSDLTKIYKDYFPNNKPEISYRFETKRTKTKFFINPKISNKEKLEYEISAGIEVRY